MQSVSTVPELNKIISSWRNQGLRVAFVPTMGNLHAGHIKLVTEARKKADKVVVSIFVNPTQFGIGEDFESYPRTEQADQEKLSEGLADLLFLPSVSEMYPNNAMTSISVGGLSLIHCGASRAGHFDGVATVVTKLFNVVKPDIALFGEKDFQQLVVIRKMVQDLNSSVVIQGIETEREIDGLAMSSRNGFLTVKERSQAPKLYKALCQAQTDVIQGRAFNEIEQEQINFLREVGFQVDYFSICKADDLQVACDKDNELVILAAARLGKPRLIDNVFFSK